MYSAEISLSISPGELRDTVQSHDRQGTTGLVNVALGKAQRFALGQVGLDFGEAIARGIQRGINFALHPVSGPISKSLFRLIYYLFEQTRHDHTSRPTGQGRNGATLAAPSHSHTQKPDTDPFSSTARSASHR